MKDNPLLQSYKQEVFDRGELIDPDNTQDWFSLTLGWAIAKGLSPKQAHEFAIYTRYNWDEK